MPPEVYSIKRHGTTVDKCENEPVQTPGCIQPQGVLLALRRSDLVILQVSENSQQHLGLTPEELLEKPVSILWGESVTESLRTYLKQNVSDRNPILFETVTIANRAGVRFDAIVHTIDDTVILELEENGTPGPAKSPTSDYFSELKRSLSRMSASPSLQSLCSMLAEEVRRITGLDRVMVYRFHADESGEVFAESKRADLQAWLNFRYPAHDIPKPAREIFKRIWMRPVPDIRAELAEMVPLANPDNGKPLDMTHCYLRGASVMYTEYLANMGVGAALTMSLRFDGELWGLIACHHYSATDLPYPLRAVCEFMAQAASLQLRGADDREHLEYRSKIDNVHLHLLSKATLSGKLDELIEGRPNLLNGISSDGAAVFSMGSWQRTGKTPGIPQLTELLEWLQGEPEFNRGLFSTDFLSAKFPAAQKYTEAASGILAVAIPGVGNTAILWFRPETIQTFTWAGDPNELPLVAGPHGPRLTPRKSFELWRESVRHRSLPWNTTEVEAARRLRASVLDILAGRAEELSRLNMELARSNEELDAFAYVAGHDLKEPLRAINKYASQLVEEAKAGRIEGAKNHERINNVVQLTHRMDDLINSLLHFSRVGNAKLNLQPFDLNEILAEAREMIGTGATGKSFTLDVPRPLPTIVCDRIRVREIFTNLIANAIKYNDSADKRVEVGYAEKSKSAGLEPGSADDRPRIEFHVRDNGIGIDSKDFEKIFSVFKRLHVRGAYGGGSGVGLAIVKKLVAQHSGQIRVESEPGKGTTFHFTLSPE